MTSDVARLNDRGFGARVGYGDRPALVVVDFSNTFTDPASALGADMGREIAEARRLMEAARPAGVPVFLSTIAYDDPASEAGTWLVKIGGLADLKLGTRGVDQDPRLGQQEGDRILVKRFASCFFGTDLFVSLREAGIDTLIVAGCTTSGCVRATAVDGCQYGFRVVVAREATADRLAAAHGQSLVDIELKYGDVRPVGEIVAYLESLAAKRPTGRVA